MLEGISGVIGLRRHEPVGKDGDGSSNGEGIVTTYVRQIYNNCAPIT